MSTTRDRYETSAYRSSRDMARAEHYRMDMRDARDDVRQALLDRYGIGPVLTATR